MIDSSWFNPYFLEVLIIPVAILLGILSVWITRRVIMGPITHLFLLILFYLWIWAHFYSFDSVQYFAIHMNDIESYLIDTFFIGVTTVLSWSLEKGRKDRERLGEKKHSSKG